MRIAYIEDISKWQSDFSFFVEVSVRFSETDLYGHLNNTVPFTYFEYARIEFLKHLGIMNDWLDPSGTTIPVVADLQCDYLKQVFFDESLKIFVKINSVGNSSMDIHYMAKNEINEIMFTGRGSLVQIGKATGKAIPWTNEEKSHFVVKLGR